MKILLKVDSRSKDFHFSKHFGNVSEFPTEFLVPLTEAEYLQPVGNSECVAISGCDIDEQKNTVGDDVDDLYNRIPHSAFGCVPQDGFSEMISGGFLRVGVPVRAKPFSSYFSAQQGTMSAADNMKSALMMTNYPIACYTNWYKNWNSGADVMEVGDTAVSAHCYVIEGWSLINGVPMFQVEAWIGKKLRMPFDVFNTEVSKLGCGTAVLSTVVLDATRKKSIMETLVDLMQNTLLLLKQLIMLKSTPQTPPSIPPSVPQPIPNPVPTQNDTLATLTNFCAKIADYEGGVNDLNHRNNNPGNCVYNLDGYLPKYGDVKQNGRFAVFPTWDLGMLYLENLVKQKAFQHPTWTIYDYFALSHAPASDGNDPLLYATTVSKEIGVTNDYLIINLT